MLGFQSSPPNLRFHFRCLVFEPCVYPKNPSPPPMETPDPPFMTPRKVPQNRWFSTWHPMTMTSQGFLGCLKKRLQSPCQTEPGRSSVHSRRFLSQKVQPDLGSIRIMDFFLPSSPHGFCCFFFLGGGGGGWGLKVFGIPNLKIIWGITYKKIHHENYIDSYLWYL